jgi:hypothetical protein
MSTPHRIEINKANSQHSTGPKTEAGKQRSSLNALRHGLTGQIVVMPTDDLAAYQQHLNAYAAEYHPQGATESDLVQSLADTSWRLNRVAVLETNLLTLGMAREPNPLTSAPPQIQDAMALVSALESQSKALSNLSMHSQRLSRQFERTIIQLRDLQKIRRAEEKQEMEKVLDIIEMVESKGDMYDPAADGFVFSDTQIMDSLRTRNRERKAEQAYEHRCEAATGSNAG